MSDAKGIIGCIQGAYRASGEEHIALHEAAENGITALEAERDELRTYAELIEGAAKRLVRTMGDWMSDDPVTRFEVVDDAFRALRAALKNPAQSNGGDVEGRIVATAAETARSLGSTAEDHSPSPAPTPSRHETCNDGPGSNTGHGHVWERPDGVKMRCGGPGFCRICSADAAHLRHQSGNHVHTFCPHCNPCRKAERLMGFEDAMVSLASWLGHGPGGGEATNPEDMEARIRQGVETIIKVETLRHQVRRNAHDFQPDGGVVTFETHEHGETPHVHTTCTKCGARAWFVEFQWDLLTKGCEFVAGKKSERFFASCPVPPDHPDAGIRPVDDSQSAINHHTEKP